MPHPEKPPKVAYPGLAFIGLSTLMFEILLTRIFSATTWYHFAFVAISVAMFGMTAGALTVYLLPGFFPIEKVRIRLAQVALAFAWSMPVCYLAQQGIPFVEDLSAVGLFALAHAYFLIAIPFYFSGIAVCIALTRFVAHVGPLYAADLAGAALGCLALVQLLDRTDGPTAVLVIAALAACGALLFAFGAGSRALSTGAVITLTVLMGSAVGNHLLMLRGEPFLRVLWVKGTPEVRPVLEAWNSFSRLTISPQPSTMSLGGGISDPCPGASDLRQWKLRIDGDASTVITEYAGDPATLEHLRCDVVNVAHYLRPGSTVMVVGVGGGRDVLAALAFDQQRVVGVEMNENILRLLTEEYGDFSGHLEKNPRVELVNDEARSYLERTEEQFGILQLSMIDTWAATAAGAFVLAENSLYTVEAWDTMLSRLRSDGLLTISRWDTEEVLRATSLARAALLRSGARNPRDHIAIVRDEDVVTVLVGRSPLTEGDLVTLKRVVQQFEFETLLTPTTAVDNELARIAEGDVTEVIRGGIPLNLAPPSDDQPFFFQMIGPGDILNSAVWGHGLPSNLKAVRILGALLLIVSVLLIGCVGIPLMVASGGKDLGGSAPYFGYFIAIGLAFMLIELSQMHRLIIFLGHPTYSLTVVLSSLLVSSAVGSYLSGYLHDGRTATVVTLVLLLVGLAIFGFLTPVLVDSFAGGGTTTRVLVAVLTLVPLGVGMGTAFPLGMRMAGRFAPSLTPWLWGLNGAASVFASVLSTAMAMTFGISTVFWTGTACYVLALVAASSWPDSLSASPASPAALSGDR